MNKKIRNIFITGIVAILPLVVTFYILRFLYGLIVSNLTPLVEQVTGMAQVELPEPLVGIITVVVFLTFIFILGLLTRIYVGRLLIGLVDKTAANIPFVNTIYTAIKQMVDSIGSSGDNFQKVVMVNFLGTDTQCIGFVVRDSQVVLSRHIPEPCYNVFIPTAPNPTSGFITVIPVSKCTDVPISVEEGVKFVISVGLMNFTDIKIK
ncbi:MAG: DUF502 domain-containing protein [Deferribacteraceae bacterium]|nr:DUF502 domain-containing protein [Deferribacteraceae bacterium]